MGIQGGKKKIIVSPPPPFPFRKQRLHSPSFHHSFPFILSLLVSQVHSQPPHPLGRRQAAYTVVTAEQTCTSRRVWQGRRWTWRLGKTVGPCRRFGKPSSKHCRSCASRGRVCRQADSRRRQRGRSAGSYPLVPAAPVRWRCGSSGLGVQKRVCPLKIQAAGGREPTGIQWTEQPKRWASRAGGRLTSNGLLAQRPGSNVLPASPVRSTHLTLCVPDRRPQAWAHSHGATETAEVLTGDLLAPKYVVSSSFLRLIYSSHGGYPWGLRQARSCRFEWRIWRVNFDPSTLFHWKTPRAWT